MTAILGSNAPPPTFIRIGDLFEVFVRPSNHEFWNRLVNRFVRSFDPVPCRVTALEQTGRTISSTIEKVCLFLLETLLDTLLARSIQDAIDELDRNLSDLMNSVVPSDD